MKTRGGSNKEKWALSSGVLNLVIFTIKWQSISLEESKSSFSSRACVDGPAPNIKKRENPQHNINFDGGFHFFIQSPHKLQTIQCECNSRGILKLFLTSTFPFTPAKPPPSYIWFWVYMPVYKTDLCQKTILYSPGLVAMLWFRFVSWFDIR